MPEFYNRHAAVARICDVTGVHHEPQIVVVTGAAKIGKSAALAASARQVQAREDGALVLWIDFAEIAQAGAEPETLKIAFLDAAALACGASIASGPDAALEMVFHLNVLSSTRQVYVMCDTVDALAGQRQFWVWLEEQFLQPLLAASHIRIVFAGRTAPPLDLYEVRRAMVRVALGTLDAQAEAALVRDVLREEAPDMAPATVEQAVDLAHRAARGHPALAVEVAREVSVAGAALTPADLCRDVVGPFVRETMLQDLPSPWDELLPWISVLNWFTSDILIDYLTALAPEAVRGRAYAFFIQGISYLRQRDYVLWREGVGYQMSDIPGELLRRCLAAQNPQAYRTACLAAAGVFEGIAAVLRNEPEQAAFYRKEAEFYQQAADELAASTGGGA